VPLVGFRSTDALSASLQYLWRDFRMNTVLARTELAEMQAELLDILHGKMRSKLKYFMPTESVFIIVVLRVSRSSRDQ